MSVVRTISLPKGTNAAPAILKSATPSGMPMIVKQRRIPVKKVGKSEPPSREDEPEDVGDGTQALEPRRTWDQHPTEGPQRVTGKLERLHTEGDADDRDAEDEPSNHVGKREPEAG